MKVMVTGVNGFIGQHWVEQLLQLGARVIATGMGAPRWKPDIDVNFQYQSLDIIDAPSVRKLLAQEKPDAVLHAAAISKPDQCALDPDLAQRVNVEGSRFLLDAADSCGAYFCFLSTDFVFDGVDGMYDESATPSPVNFYGQTKWEAEQLVQQYSHGWSIARTVSVYGPPVPGRPNLLSIVIEKLSSGQTYSVVDDQIRTPTYAGDLAWGVGRLIADRHVGIFHLSGEDVMTPYEMAVRTAQHMHLDPAGIRRVTEATFQQPAIRPKRTGFNIAKAKQQIGFQPRSFESGLHASFPIR